MVKQAFADAVEWVKAHPKFSTCAACLVVGVILGLWF